MKSIFKNIFISLLALTLLLSVPMQSLATTSTEDQYCDNDKIAASDNYWLIKAHTSLAQTFKPSKNRLTSIMLALAGGADVTAPVTMTLSLVGGGVIATKVEATSSALVSWVEFDLPVEYTLDTTKTYQITVTSTSNTARWIVSTTPCYANGTAIVNTSAQENQDFGFVTMGYTYTAPAPAPVAPNKPTNLAGKYNADLGGIRITWTKSTTSDIDGYRVYRSLKKTSEYSQIAKVGKTVSSLLDMENIVEEETYYYIVKAYKGDLKSEGSNTLTVVVPKFEVPVEEEVVDDTTTPVVDDNQEVTTEDEGTKESVLNTLVNTVKPYLWYVGAVLLGIVAITSVILFIIQLKGDTPKKLEEKKEEVKKEEKE